MTKPWLWLSFVFVLCIFVSCQGTAPVSDTPKRSVVSKDQPDQAEDDVFFYKYAPTTEAKKEDVLKALQGEWSSKENGFNYKLIFSGNTMQIGYSDNDMTAMSFDVIPGMPMQIVPGEKTFDQSKGKGYRTPYHIEKMYFINDRILLLVKSVDNAYTFEDELVLSRSMTREQLREIEPAEPKPNLVFNDKTLSQKDILKSIQGEWTGRDNCNYEVTIDDTQFTLWNGGRAVLKSKLHLSKQNPAHIELDTYHIDSGHIQDDLYGVYYLDDSAFLISIHSGYQGDKYEYILRRPAHLGRLIMDDEILPELQGKWIEMGSNNILTIQQNKIEYDGTKDTFHVVTRNPSDIKTKSYWLVGANRQSMYHQTILDHFNAFQYDGKTLKTSIPILDARAPEFIFVRMSE